MMSRLMQLVPLKKLIRGFVGIAVQIMPEEKPPTNLFLVWLKDVVDRTTTCDVCANAGDLIRNMARVSFSVVSEDEAWRRSLLGFVAQIRAAPTPPYTNWERELIKKRYKCEAV